MASVVVLVVDDEPSIVELLTEILEDEGYKVVGARDGREAFAIAVLLLPDIVLTDIAMPFMNGSELRDRLHADARTCRTPVILMSAGPPPAPGGRRCAGVPRQALRPRACHPRPRTLRHRLNLPYRPPPT